MQVLYIHLTEIDQNAACHEAGIFVCFARKCFGFVFQVCQMHADGGLHGCIQREAFQQGITDFSIGFFCRIIQAFDAFGGFSQISGGISGFAGYVGVGILEQGKQKCGTGFQFSFGSELCQTDRENYEKYWDDISPFIKFGCIRDQKFNDKMKDYIIFKNMEGKYVTLPDYLEAGKEKYENNVFYITDEVAQSQYINMFKEQEIDAIYLTHQIDTTFITHLEQRNPEVKFLRIDSELTDNFKETIDENEEKELTEKLSEKFKKATGVENLSVKVEKLKNADMPSMITVSEQTRRMSEMMEMYGMSNSSTGLGAEGETLVLNMNNDLVQYVLNNDESENTTTICQQLYDLARLANHPLKPEEMTAFVARSNKILSILTK